MRNFFIFISSVFVLLLTACNSPFLPKEKGYANFKFPEKTYQSFNAPNIPNEERDVSAATILASGLLELAELDKSKAKKYRSYADKILENLQNEKYRTNQSPFFLQHSVGGKPNKVEIDVPIIYADYYYLEALLKYQKNYKN